MPRRTDAFQSNTQQPMVTALGDLISELVQRRKDKHQPPQKAPSSPPGSNARRSDGTPDAPLKFFVKDHLGNSLP